MIQEIKLSSIEDIMSLAFEQRENEENGRYRSPYFYRGMPNSSYKLETSLKRNCGEKSRDLEKHILNNFIKYIRTEDPSINESIWKAMTVGQHHGLPTRLLDWTHSTLVALNFATSVGNLAEMENNDAVVWRIDAKEINNKLPEKYKNKLQEDRTFIFSLESFADICDSLSSYDNDMQDKGMAIIEPPSLDQRIVNQYAFFSIVPQGIESIEAYLENNTENTVKYIIDKSLKWKIRDILDQMNVNERIIYPGIDGIAQWLGRHYFVKKEEDAERTIAEAAAEILKAYPNGLTYTEIYHKILERELYVFGAKDPEDVVRATLMKHCMEINAKWTLKNKLFSVTGIGKHAVYTLIK